MQKVASQLNSNRVRGFLTHEIRNSGKRMGFRIRSLDGRQSTLAHIDITAGYRVGQYGVDVGAVDDIIDHCQSSDRHTDLYLIDEIGKMECFSAKFTRFITELLDLRFTLVATIALKGGGFIDQVKSRPDVEIWQVTKQNRDQLSDQILDWLGR